MANPSSEHVKQTPMMRQYLEIKQAHPDSILFFRLGDFYEMFFEDAEIASKALDLTLTARSKGEDAVPMCGVPHFSAGGYIAKLLDQGFKVAVCDQVEDPRLAKGIVRREVTRVVSPGMITDPDNLDGREANYLAVILPEADPNSTGVGDDGLHFGLAFMDVSSADFRCTELTSWAALVDELARVRPREVLLPDGRLDDPWVERLRRRFKGMFFKGLGSAAPSHEVAQAFGSTFAGADDRAHQAARACYGVVTASLNRPLEHVRRLVAYQACDHLVIDEASRANLELTRTAMEGQRKGSLLWVLDQTRTPLGARRLCDWMLFPLLDPACIAGRADAVQALVDDALARADLRDALTGVRDLERLLGKIAVGQGTPRDLGALRDSLGRLPVWCGVLGRPGLAPLAALLGEQDPLPDLHEQLAAALVDSPPPNLDEGGALRPGYHAELDRLVELASSGRAFISRLESEERGRTGIQSLKIRFNKIFGYYIEVTKPNLHLVPPEYRRKQTTVNAERFETEALKAQEEAVLRAQEDRVALERELVEQLYARVREVAERLQRVASGLAVSDCLASLAEVAARHGYHRPVVDAGEGLSIRDGRHPVVEQLLSGERFVPNDLEVDCAREQLLVITGPNMAGKSTVIRQTALIAILAQMGAFVPAREARIGVVDRIFTRIGAADNLARGQSTFMVEMMETANILQRATRRSLLILDEVGRGTSTFDGMSIAWAAAEYIHDAIGARTLFATHYHQLADLPLTKPRVVNYTISVKEWKDQILFLRRLVPGSTSRSYGIQVAKLAGLPAAVIERAKEILANLEGEEYDEVGAPRFSRSQRRKTATGGAQLQLFAAPRPPPAWLAEFEGLDVNGLTPLQALSLLHRWKEKA